MTAIGLLVWGCVASGPQLSLPSAADASDSDRRMLYVAGKGSVRVYDVDRGHRLVTKIVLKDRKKTRGIVAHAASRRLYVSYDASLACIDLSSHEILWTRRYDSGADRMALTPDGRTIYLPSGFWTDTPYWYVIDAASGDVIRKLSFHAAAHNTLVGASGRFAYLASRRHRSLAVVRTDTHEIVREIGPFGNFTRPFTIDAEEAWVFVNVDDLLGFEVANLRTGEVLHRVEVEGFAKGPVEHHHTPSHGIGMTPDERELWVVDAANQRLHVFDKTTLPPKQTTSIEVNGEPTWITFGIEGRLAYPSTGDVIDVKRKTIIATLRKNNGKRLRSEKMLQIDYRAGVPIRVGNQFGVGRRTLRP